MSPKVALMIGSRTMYPMSSESSGNVVSRLNLQALSSRTRSSDYTQAQALGAHARTIPSALSRLRSCGCDSWLPTPWQPVRGRSGTAIRQTLTMSAMLARLSHGTQFRSTYRAVEPCAGAGASAHDDATAAMRLALVLVNANVVMRRAGRVALGDEHFIECVVRQFIPVTVLVDHAHADALAHSPPKITLLQSLERVAEPVDHIVDLVATQIALASCWVGIESSHGDGFVHKAGRLEERPIAARRQDDVCAFQRVVGQLVGRNGCDVNAVPLQAATTKQRRVLVTMG